MAEVILGISAYYHDSAAAIIVNGEIIAAAQEERFSRKKNDASFPRHAVEYVLEEAGFEYNSLTAVAFYDKPFIKFERLLETYHAFTPKGLRSFITAIPIWIKEKLFMKKLLNDELSKFGNAKIPILFPEHHLSHAASAFFPSPYQEAAILTVDGVGEWATTTLGMGSGNKIKVFKEQKFPHSLGLLYSAFTYYCGFRVNSGEYKLMGLAPYGNKGSEQTKIFIDLIFTHLVDLRDDGSFLLNMDYFEFATGFKMTRNQKWEQLFGVPKREPESEISQPYMNLALAIQLVTEEIMLRLCKSVKELTHCDYLVLAGGVALNCVANGKIMESGLFKEMWIQPAAGDAGGALGAALAGWYIWQGKERKADEHVDQMKGAYLGPGFSKNDVLKVLRKYNAKYSYCHTFDEVSLLVAQYLANGKVVAWVQGRMEFGPRALGNRSILGDARNPEMQKKLNLKVKFREGFRPFAPSVLEEDKEEFFQLCYPSPYMSFVVPVNERRRNPEPVSYRSLPLYERLYHLRSDIPAITHIDYSARIQTVNKRTNPKYYALITDFKNLTGYGLLVNTSFNVRGEPIVCNPEDAWRCFMMSEIDILVIDKFIVVKSEQHLENSNFIKSDNTAD